MSKNKPHQNSFDLLVEKLIEEFSKIPNFDLTQKDETANKLFNTISFRISDISSFKELVINHYVPATNKAIFNSQQQMLKSRYRYLLTLNQEDFRETLYQTIRLSYVGLFHKLESYINDISIMSELFIEEPSNETVEKYAKRKFDFNIRDWQQFFVTHKINWVCICVKHYDSFPLKKPKPILCEKYSEDKRLQLTVEDFKTDTELLLKFCPVYLQIMFLIAQHKLSYENYNRNEWEDIPEMLKIHDEYEEKQTQLIKNLLLQLNAIAG